MGKSRLLTCGFPTSIATMIAACLTFVDSLIFTLIYYYVFVDARAFHKKDSYKHTKRFIYMSIFVSTLVLVSIFILTMIFTILLLVGQCKRKPSFMRAFLVFTIFKCIVVAAAGSVLIYIGVPRQEAIATVCVIVVHIYFATVVAKSRREMLGRPPVQQISMVSVLQPPAPTLFQPVTSQFIYPPSAPVMGDVPAAYSADAPPAYYSNDHENYPPDYYAEYHHNQFPTNPQAEKSY